MHIPVLQKEVLRYLDAKPNENFIDATIGEAGHTLAILEKNGPQGKVLGIEIDKELYEKLEASKIKNQKSEIKNRLILVNDSYSNLKEIVERENFGQASGILFDLGLSSWHLEKSGRGFSFLKNESLDMRYNHLNPLTAEKILNYYSRDEIEKILREYGQEKFSKKISGEIIETRKIKQIRTTLRLVEIIKKAVPARYERGRIHPATRTFQALRIAVNNELNDLEIALPQAAEILKPGGRLVAISFHSLEDRIVKNFFKENCQEKNSHGRAHISRAEPAGRSEVALSACQILTKKPIIPTNEEIKINPRSRSAKLRACQKF